MIRDGVVNSEAESQREDVDGKGGGTGGDAEDMPSVDPRDPVLDPDDALERLREGNRRYVAGKPHRFRLDEARRIEMVEGQTPLATIFACVDSRVPVERVFDQAHGELLVVRTAAHVLDDATLGSIQFGVAVLSTPLVIVLGHQRCGAVEAAINYARTGEKAPGKIQTIVDGITPAVEQTREGEPDRLEDAIRTHSRNVGEKIRNSPLISDRCGGGSLRIVPAYYSMLSGEVEFL